MDDWYTLVDRKLAKLPGRTGKDIKTVDEVFDKRTLFSIYKLFTKGILDSLDFPISTGKEGNVFKGSTPGGAPVAVKIYRTNTATFKHLLKYIQGDPRFENTRRDQHSMILAWTQKEFKNLHRLRDAGIDVPEPIACHNNILVMEYLGDDDGPSPRLKDVLLKNERALKKAYNKVTGDMVRAYQKANLIHADLSEFNILVDNGKSRIIDVGQAVVLTHPNAEEFLLRDVKNVTRYFNKLGLDVGEKELLDRITGEKKE